MRDILKKHKKDPKQLGITSHYIHSSSSSHKSIELSASVPRAPAFGWGPKQHVLPLLLNLNWLYTGTFESYSLWQNHHMWFCAISHAIFLSSSHHPKHYRGSDFETCLHKKNWRSKPKLNLTIKPKHKSKHSIKS